MKKYVIYAIGGQPITTLEAEEFEVDFNKQRVLFQKDNCKISAFNFDNIAGFKEFEQSYEI